jgi:hypothetical protein
MRHISGAVGRPILSIVRTTMSSGSPEEHRMSIQVDPVRWLRELLRSVGFHHHPLGHRPLPPGLDVLARNDGTAAAIVHPPRLTPPQLGGAPLSEQFDAHLQRILRRLQSLAENGVHVHHLFFIGNGPLTIPRWFREACAELGMHIHTVDPAVPPESLAPFL